MVRQALSRERLEFHGETLELPLPDGPGKALKLTIAPVQERIPIYLAAIGPEQHAPGGRGRRRLDPDAVLPRARRRVPAVARGGRGARRALDLNGFDIAPTVQVFVTDDLAGARDAMRPFIALYVGGMGSRKQNFYNQLVQRYGFEDAAREVQDLYLEGKREEAMAALPDELIDHGGARRPARPRARAPGRLPRRRRRDPGHHADGVGPGGAPRAAAPHRRACRRLTVGCGCSWAPSATRGTRSRSSRSGGALAARGHEVVLQTWTRWEDDVRAAGMRFEAAPEYHVFPTRERPLKPYEAVVRATGQTRPLVAALRPDAVVADILTLAPALAGELEGVPVATVIPHTDPRIARGWPPYSVGARLPRTAVGRRAVGRHCRGLTDAGLEHGRRELNETRRRLGLGPLDRVHGGISQALALVATFPALEYPRAAALPATHIVGPLLWEPPAEDVELPPGDEPLVLVAPSTSQDPSHELLRATLRGLAGAAGAGPRRVEPPAAGRAGRRARERAPGRLALLRADDAAAATSSSVTAATARSRARWPAAAPSSSSPPRAT